MTTKVTSDMRAKVMSLGNKLAAKGKDRSAAFIQAWAIVKAGAVELPLKGVTAGRRQEALRRLAKYSPEQVRVFTVPEPDNAFDSNATAVMCDVQNGRGYYKLGYIPAGDTGIAAAVRGKASINVLTGDIHGARLTLAV